MNPSNDVFFSSDLWTTVLEKYAEATGLTVKLFDADGRVVFGPLHPTPLFRLFIERGYDPGILAECARRCLAQTENRPAIVVSQLHGLAVVGTSLVLEGKIVGAAVGGYVFVDFSQVSEIQNLARDAGIKFEQLWQVARQQKPVPERRLILDGELLQVLGDALLREIYRARQYEEAVVELEKAGKAKDQFIAVVSHELRTPLTPILMWARMLKSNSDPSRISVAMETIERNAMLQLRLIEDLLDLNRLATGKMNFEIAEQDISAILRSAVESVQGEAEKNRITLYLAGAGEPLRVQADAGRLQEVFANILSNAVKFTPEGGAIRVRLADEDNNAVVKFRDTGVGIAPDFLPHVFEMFRQQEDGMRRSHPGLGIGLAIAKSLVELHGGDIEVKSEGVGRGTEVTVRLPLLPSAPPVELHKIPAAPARLSSTLHGTSILLVEDSDDSRDATEFFLKQVGAQVTSAANGREALDALAAAHPDVILCDLAMPKMDGFEFIEELRQIRGPDYPPVIAVSGLATEADHARTSAAGFAGYLDKPFDDISLVAAIRSAQKHAAETESRDGASRNPNAK